MQLRRYLTAIVCGLFLWMTGCGGDGSEEQNLEHSISGGSAKTECTTTSGVVLESTHAGTDTTQTTHAVHTFDTTSVSMTNPADGTANTFFFSTPVRSTPPVSSTTQTTATSATATTTTTADDAAAYAWYDALNAEFEACGGYTCLRLSDGTLFSYQNKIYGLHNADGIYRIFSVDEKNKGTIVASGNGSDHFYFQDGIFYIVGGSGVRRVSADGASLGSCALPSYACLYYPDDPDKNQFPEFVAPASNGRFIISETRGVEGKVAWETHLYLVDSDYQHKLRLTTPKRWFHIRCIGSYQDKLYFSVLDCEAHLSESIYYLDLKLKTWHELTGWLELQDSWYSTYCIGKYLFQSHQVYNMEDDSTWFRLYEYTPYPFGANSYFGGNYHIDSAGNGCQIAPDTSAEAVSVGKQRHVVVNKSGVFVYTYENGEETKHTALLWE